MGLPFFIRPMIDDSGNSSYRVLSRIISYKRLDFRALQACILFRIKHIPDIHFQIRNIIETVFIDNFRKSHEIVHRTFCLYLFYSQVFHGGKSSGFLHKGNVENFQLSISKFPAIQYGLIIGNLEHRCHPNCCRLNQIITFLHPIQKVNNHILLYPLTSFLYHTTVLHKDAIHEIP